MCLLATCLFVFICIAVFFLYKKTAERNEAHSRQERAEARREQDEARRAEQLALQRMRQNQEMELRRQELDIEDRRMQAEHRLKMTGMLLQQPPENPHVASAMAAQLVLQEFSDAPVELRGRIALQFFRQNQRTLTDASTEKREEEEESGPQQGQQEEEEPVVVVEVDDSRDAQPARSEGGRATAAMMPRH